MVVKLLALALALRKSLALALKALDPKFQAQTIRQMMIILTLISLNKLIRTSETLTINGWKTTSIMPRRTPL
jgi:hypothetical protein